MSLPVTLETIRLRNSTVDFWDNGIIYIKIDDNSEITLADSAAQHRLLKEKYDGKKRHKILVEPGRYTTITPEAREFSGRPDSNNMTIASAVIVKSLAHRIVINFMINFTQKQNMRMRMFETKEKAIEWLLSFD